MFFEVANIAINPFLPPLVAFLISIFTSTAGISGAFVLLPFQLSILNFTAPSVSATNQLYNVVAIPFGLYSYIREGRMIWQLALIVIFATLPGVFIGVLVRINFLAEPSTFQIFAGLVIIFLGYRLLKESINGKKSKAYLAETKFFEYVKELNPTEKRCFLKVQLEKFNVKELEFEFAGERFVIKTIPIFFVSLIVGIVGGIYGIGGGAILSPIYVSFFGLPVYVIAGPALFGTFVTSAFAVIIFQVLAPFYPSLNIAPDWKLGLLFGIGGILGIYLGAKIQKFLPAKFIKLILGFSLLLVGLYYVFSFVLG
ncbi:MAG: sulfite exporter TauE/SafE family protein [Ignavibacteria bacterium]|nr:sulfite exporter TauE/SafE family protein [Ignavibacteria bacterium]